MTFDETRGILKIIRAGWPHSFSTLTRQGAEEMLNLWAAMFKDDDPAVVALAVKAIIAGENREFAPSIGVVKDKMRQLTAPKAIGELEAWALVKKAVSRGYYNSVEEFNKLPPEIQKLVGSHSAIRDWAVMDASTFESVVGSNFQKGYRTQMKREQEYAAIPADVKKAVEALSKNLGLGDGKNGGRGKDGVGALPGHGAYPGASGENEKPVVGGQGQD